MALKPEDAKFDQICLFVAGCPGCKKQDVVKSIGVQFGSIDTRINLGWIVDAKANVRKHTELYVTHKWLHHVRGGL